MLVDFWLVVAFLFVVSVSCCIDVLFWGPDLGRELWFGIAYVYYSLPASYHDWFFLLAVVLAVLLPVLLFLFLWPISLLFLVPWGCLSFGHCDFVFYPGIYQLDGSFCV